MLEAGGRDGLVGFPWDSQEGRRGQVTVVILKPSLLTLTFRTGALLFSLITQHILWDGIAPTVQVGD